MSTTGNAFYSNNYVTTTSASSRYDADYYFRYEYHGFIAVEKADAKQIAEGWDPDANP